MLLLPTRRTCVAYLSVTNARKVSIVTKDRWRARTGCRWCRVCMLSSILAPSSSCSRSCPHKQTCTLARTHAAYCVRARARALTHTHAVHVPDTDACIFFCVAETSTSWPFFTLSPHLVCATGLTLGLSLSLAPALSRQHWAHQKRLVELPFLNAVSGLFLRVTCCKQVHALLSQSSRPLFQALVEDFKRSYKYTGEAWKCITRDHCGIKVFSQVCVILKINATTSFQHVALALYCIHQHTSAYVSIMNLFSKPWTLNAKP
jgi:hypothetical protein